MDALQYLKEKYEIEGNTHYFREPDLPLSTSLEKVCKYMHEYSDQQNAELMSEIERWKALSELGKKSISELIKANEKLESVESENAELREAINLCRKSICDEQTINRGLNDRLAKLQDKLRFENDLADDALKTQEFHIDQLRNQIADLERENSEYRYVYDSVVKSRDELRERMNELEAKIASYESSIDGLKKVVDSLYNLRS